MPVGTLKTWRCNLRKGVEFRDGSAFDSRTSKFSFDRVTNKTIVKEAAANSPSSLFGNLKSVKTNGKYAVTFNLKSPQGDLAVDPCDAGGVHRVVGLVRAEPPARKH